MENTINLHGVKFYYLYRETKELINEHISSKKIKKLDSITELIQLLAENKDELVRVINVKLELDMDEDKEYTLDEFINLYSIYLHTFSSVDKGDIKFFKEFYNTFKINLTKEATKEQIDNILNDENNELDEDLDELLNKINNKTNLSIIVDFLEKYPNEIKNINTFIDTKEDESKMVDIIYTGVYEKYLLKLYKEINSKKFVDFFIYDFELVRLDHILKIMDLDKFTQAVNSIKTTAWLYRFMEELNNYDFDRLLNELTLEQFKQLFDNEKLAPRIFYIMDSDGAEELIRIVRFKEHLKN